MKNLKNRALTSISIAVLLLLNCNLSFAQEKLQYVALTDAEEKEIDKENFKAIDSYFDGVKIVGLGESTHGTSEFHTIRAELFKYLVEKKAFNTFFLEADYAACIPINDYISGESIDIKKGMKELNWPWQTEELLALIEWMRSYNSEHEPSESLRFFGSDGQWPDYASKQLNDLLLSYGRQTLDSVAFPVLTNQAFQSLKKRDLKKMLVYIESWKQKDFTSFSNKDQSKYQLLINNLTQSLEIQLSKNSTLRDVYMAQNMLSYLKRNPETKGIFWAHNIHVYTVLDRYDKKRGVQHGMAGGILQDILKDQYVSIIQDFDYGSFIAWHKIDDSKKEGFESYDLGKVTIEKSIPNSYGEKLRSIKEEIIFIDLAKNDLEISEFKSHTIGAVFHANKKNPNQTTQFNYCPTGGCYDAVLFTKESTPTQLIGE